MAGNTDSVVVEMVRSGGGEDGGNGACSVRADKTQEL